jgi:hypothetical protein
MEAGLYQFAVVFVGYFVLGIAGFRFCPDHCSLVGMGLAASCSGALGAAD